MTRRPPHSPTPGGRRTLSERRGRDRRALLVGLAVSAVLHLVAIALVSDWLAPEASPPQRVPEAVMVETPPGMRMVDIMLDLDPGTVAPPDVPEPDRRPENEPERRPVVAVETPTTARSADERSAADRLAPRVVDPRLWQPMILIPREPTLGDVEARIAAAVELLSDSALAEADAAIRATDWTVKDDSGGKWGISPGKLHLGSVTLPLPIWFPEDPQALEAQAMWYELDQQLERTRILDSFEERVRAIRERRERERAEAKGKAGDNGGG